MTITSVLPLHAKVFEIERGGLRISRVGFAVGFNEYAAGRSNTGGLAKS